MEMKEVENATLGLDKDVGSCSFPDASVTDEELGGINLDEVTQSNASKSQRASGFCSASQIYQANKISCYAVENSPYMPTSSTEPLGKRRRIHVNDLESYNYSKTGEGMRPLKTPQLVKTSSVDPHRGLYPPLPAVPSSGFPIGFQKASVQFNPEKQLYDQFKQQSQGIGSPTKDLNVSPTKRKSKPKSATLPAQSNTLDNYYTVKRNTGMCTSSSTTTSNSVSLKESPSKEVKMYSPIKKKIGEGTIYIMDDDDPADLHRDSTIPQQAVGYVKRNVQPGRNKSSKPLKSKKSLVPKFNRDNSFLYSNGPVTNTTMCNTKKKKSDDKYGLLGTGTSFEDSDDETDYVSILPYEVTENILCRLPLMDLYLNVNRVCKSWNGVISNADFVPWKKKYYRLLSQDRNSLQDMTDILQRNEFHGIDNYLPGVIRYVKEYKPASGRNLTQSLIQHRLYNAAQELILERFPDCMHNDVPNPWCLIVVVIFLSPNVADIQELILCLLQGNSHCTALELLECLYCINCFLLMFKTIRYNDIWTGMHYRLYYALYLYENELMATCDQLGGALRRNKGQQSIMKYSSGDSSVRMTHEQVRICNHDIQPGQIIKVVAFAGTGKTTTLVKYTQLRPGLKFLLVVYNKSVCDHAKSRFPGNVECKTGHALAFRYVGRRYAAKKMLGNTKVNDIVQNLQKRKGESLFVQAKFVQDTINNFLASDHELITSAHVPDQRMEENGKLYVPDHATKMNLANDAEKIWRKMIDLDDKTMKMSHDGYLKLYQLRKPVFRGYDVILIDEAQDLTPCITDLLMNQTQAKVLVGDPHQQIYSFRGAVNAMQQVTDSHTFYLTQSFRFGPEIAFVASICLEFLKGEKKKMLVGNGIPGGIKGEKVGQLAIICRTNATLFSEAVKKCCYSDENIRVAFAGGIDSFGFDMILDIYNLMLPPEERKRQIRHNLVKCFPSFDELQKFAIKTNDHELLGKIKIVRTYHHSLPSFISKILSKADKTTDTADIVFSTAHKAKGLEFNTVQLTDDYNVTPECVATLRNTPKDEANLLYVAVTRAKRRLLLSPTLLKLLSCAGETFHRPVYSKSLLAKEQSKLVCLETSREFEPQSITLVKDDVTLGTGMKITGGPCCPQIVRELVPSLKNLLGSVKDEMENTETVPTVENY